MKVEYEKRIAELKSSMEGDNRKVRDDYERQIREL